MRQKTAKWIKLRCGMAVMTTKTFWVASKACKGHAAMTAFTGPYRSSDKIRAIRVIRFIRDPKGGYAYSLRTEVFYP